MTVKEKENLETHRKQQLIINLIISLVLTLEFKSYVLGVILIILNYASYFDGLYYIRKVYNGKE